MMFPNDIKSIFFVGKPNLELHFSAIPHSFTPNSLQVPYSLSPDSYRPLYLQQLVRTPANEHLWSYRDGCVEDQRELTRVADAVKSFENTRKDADEQPLRMQLASLKTSLEELRTQLTIESNSLGRLNILDI